MRYLESAGDIIRIKRGLYVVNPDVSHVPLSTELIANLQFSRFKTVAEKFPQTSTAKEVLGRCDKLVDYTMKSYVNLYQKHE